MTGTQAGDLKGRVFRRSLLLDAQGEEDRTSRVEWIQGNYLYCDLRHTADGRTEGFAGPLVELNETAGFTVEWVHDIDVPRTGKRDAGRLTRIGETTLAEYGHFEDYLEHWEILIGPERRTSLRQPIAAGQQMNPMIQEYTITAPEGRGILVRVGSRFGLAIEQSGNSEVSVGNTGRSAWTISRSSKAGNCGQRLVVNQRDNNTFLRSINSASKNNYQLHSVDNPSETGQAFERNS